MALLSPAFKESAPSTVSEQLTAARLVHIMKLLLCFLIRMLDSYGRMKVSTKCIEVLLINADMVFPKLLCNLALSILSLTQELL